MSVSKIGKRLKKVREDNRKKPEEVSEFLGMSMPNYLKIERDEIDISRVNLVKLAKFYHVTVDELISSDTLTVNVTNQSGGKSYTGVNQSFQELNEEVKEVHKKYEQSLERTIEEQKSEIELLKEQKKALRDENTIWKSKITELEKQVGELHKKFFKNKIKI